MIILLLVTMVILMMVMVMMTDGQIADTDGFYYNAEGEVESAWKQSKRGTKRARYSKLKENNT